MSHERSLAPKIVESAIDEFMGLVEELTQSLEVRHPFFIFCQTTEVIERNERLHTVCPRSLFLEKYHCGRFYVEMKDSRVANVEVEGVEHYCFTGGKKVNDTATAFLCILSIKFLHSICIHSHSGRRRYGGNWVTTDLQTLSVSIICCISTSSNRKNNTQSRNCESSLSLSTLICGRSFPAARGPVRNWLQLSAKATVRKPEMKLVFQVTRGFK